jgi:hypothetical protein
MALTWDSTACDLPEKLDDNLANTRHTLIFATMAVGMNHITEDNAEAFFLRVNFYERLMGAYRFASDTEKPDEPAQPLMFTIEDIRQFVGLRTNVSPQTDAQFRKNMWENHIRWNAPRS